MRGPYGDQAGEAWSRPSSIVSSAGGRHTNPHAFAVYDWCMARVRTNIEIEDRYVRAIMDRFGVRSKTEAVDLALRHLAGQPMTRQEAMAMRGAHAILEPPAEVGLPEAG